MPPERGTMRFVDGSHRLGVLGKMRDTPEDNVESRYPSVFRKHALSPPLDLKAGDATVHHSLTIHSAPANTTTEARIAFVVQYFAADCLYIPSGDVTVPEIQELTFGAAFDHPRFPVITISSSA